MSDRVAILLKAFPDIPIWEWLEELATRELTKEHTNSTVHIKKEGSIEGDYQCTHCGRGGTHMGIVRHHTMIHVKNRRDCGVQYPLEGGCIQTNNRRG